MLALAFTLVAADPASAQRRAAVTFSVDAQYADLNRGDRIVLRGSSPELGAWEEDTRLRADGTVWSGTVRFSSPGETVTYKYAIVRQGGEEVWEDGADRRMVVPAAATELPVVAFSGRESPGLSSPVRVTFAVDLSDVFFNGDPPESVALYGNRSPLGWTMPEDRLAIGEGVRLTPDAADSLWTATVEFPAGTQPDVQFKLAIQMHGRWEWEYLPGHINHALVLDPSQSSARVRVMPNPETGRLVVSGPPRLLVDDYGAIVERVGARGAQSHYAYAHAIELARAGKLADARLVYEGYSAPSGAFIDDFPQIYAAQLAATGAVGEAGVFLLEHQRAATSATRRADLAYARAELMLRQGQTFEARRLLRSILRDFEGEEEASRGVGYARTALANSLIQGVQPPSPARGGNPDPGPPVDPPEERTDQDSIAVGIALLQEAASGQAGERRVGAMNLLAHTYESLGRMQEARTTYQQMEGEGTPAERFRALRSRVRLQLQAGEAEAVVAEADTRLAETGLTARQQGSWLYAKARALRQLGDTEAERTTLEALVAVQTRGAAVSYAKGRLAELVEG